MQITIGITVRNDKWTQSATRTLSIAIRDGYEFLFDKINFGDIVSDHVASAVEEYDESLAAEQAGTKSSSGPAWSVVRGATPESVGLPS